MKGVKLESPLCSTGDGGGGGGGGDGGSGGGGGSDGGDEEKMEEMGLETEGNLQCSQQNHKNVHLPYLPLPATPPQRPSTLPRTL